MPKRRTILDGYYRGDFVYPEEDDTVEFVKPFPCAFFKANLDFDELWETYGSNHIHAVYGDFVDVLEDFLYHCWH